jgi:hypothetical protein
MAEPLQGYWNIHQAIQTCDLAAEEARASREASEGSPFGGVNFGRSPADVLRKALESGLIWAAGIATADGSLVTIEPRIWRLEFRRKHPMRPPAHFGGWHDDAPRVRAEHPPLLMAFPEAQAGRPIARVVGQLNVGSGWVAPLIAQADLARWIGEDPPAEPLERPKDWPAPTPPRPATAEQLEWFVLGYAVRAVEAGKPATRDDVREAVLRENMGTAREAESAHAGLPARLKNPNRSKGSNRPK